MASRDKIIAVAEKLVAKGKIENAIKEYERLLDDNPNDVNTLNRIGDLWVRINRSDEAVRVFGRIADHYSRDGFFLKAIAIYKKINKIDPSRLEIYSSLAELYAKQGLAMEAKSQYLVLADYHLKQGDPRSALDTYKKIAELDPNSINVHVKLADLYHQNNQKDAALKEYDRVGRLLLRRGMLEEAVQVFRKALKIDAGNIELVESLVHALMEAKGHGNAIKILETSLESNPDHPTLVSLLGRVHLEKGDPAAAETILEQAWASNPENPQLSEALAELAVKQRSPDRALELFGPRIAELQKSGQGRKAIELLQRVLQSEPGHAPTLQKIVDVYQSLNEETHVLASMNSLAEAHIGNRDFRSAATVLEELVRREPDNAQHREKLTFVRQQMGEPAAPVAAEPAKPAEPPRPPATAPTGDFSIDLDASPSIDLDLDLDVAEPSVPDRPPAEAESEIEDLDFVTEHMTEAEVFAKYGLVEKAADHLQSVIDRAPRHLLAHERLFRLMLDEGDDGRIANAATTYLRVLEEAVETATVESVENELASRGIVLTTATSPEPSVAAPPTETAAAEAPQVVHDFEVDEEVEIEVEIEEEPVVAGQDFTFEVDAQPPAEAEPFFGVESEQPVPSSEELSEVDFYIEQELYDEAHTRLAALREKFQEHPELVTRTERVERALRIARVEERPTAPPETFEPLEEQLEPELVEERPEAEATEERPEIELPEEEPEIELPEEEPVTEGVPEEPPEMGLPEEQPAEEAPLEGPPEPVEPIPASPQELSADDIETELLSAIPDDDEFGTVIASSAKTAGEKFDSLASTPAEEENLFTEEEDFFDLAAELEEELEEDGRELALSEEEQSLEDVFREFKKGVEQQLDSEDYDTHYNLGIAYKEMELIDEAIGEFQLASKDPKRAVECCSMLGLCFLEKGMPQLAIKWYRKGIEMPEISEEEHLGLLYELASAYLEVGDTPEAHKAFIEIYGVNSNYRDIVERIKQLENVARS